jgi:hypothetical protein
MVGKKVDPMVDYSVLILAVVTVANLVFFAADSMGLKRALSMAALWVVDLAVRMVSLLVSCRVELTGA